MHRRSLLKLAGALATGAYVPTQAQTATGPVAWSSNPFGLGVASGSPTADGVVLWTRIAPAALPADAPHEIQMRWELALDAQFLQGVASGLAVAHAALGHSVHVEVAGLEPDRWYYFRFVCADAVSTVGRTRTLPAPAANVDALRLVYASCQKWEDGYFTAWKHAKADAPDLVVFLGDYLYEYPGTNSKLRVPGGGWLVTLRDYRKRYALYKTDPDLQAMHAACPWLLVWDDHEVQNDYAGQVAGDSGPRDFDPANFLDRRAAAYQAYYENMPLRASVLTQGLEGLTRGAEMRIYGEVRWGTLAALQLVDCRQYKDPQVCNQGGKLGSSVLEPLQCAALAQPSRTLLGTAQEQWLDQQWARSVGEGVRWNLLAQTTLLGPRNFGSDTAPKIWNDGWDGYPAARERLLQSIQKQKVRNLVVLGGDVHENWVGHVKADYRNPQSEALGVELCGTSITSHSGAKVPSPEMMARNPHFIFADPRQRGYGLVNLTAQKMDVQLRVLDDVQQQNSGVSTLARFRVLSGHPRIEQVKET